MWWEWARKEKCGRGFEVVFCRSNSLFWWERVRKHCPDRWSRSAAKEWCYRVLKQQWLWKAAVGVVKIFEERWEESSWDRSFKVVWKSVGTLDWKSGAGELSDRWPREAAHDQKTDQKEIEMKNCWQELLKNSRDLTKPSSLGALKFLFKVSLCIQLFAGVVFTGPPSRK